MKVLYVIGILLLLLLLLSRLRMGAEVEFSQTGLGIRLRIGPFRIRLLPARPGRTGGKKPKKTETEKRPPTHPKPRGGLLDLVLEFLPLVLDTVKRFRRRLQVDTLNMELTVAASDPADAAMQYGQANGLMASLWQPITQVFHVKDGRAHIGIDFDAGKPTLYLLASLSLTLGQAVSLGAVFAGKALGILIRVRRKQKHSQQLTQRKAVNNGTQPSHQ